MVPRLTRLWENGNSRTVECIIQTWFSFLYTQDQENKKQIGFDQDILSCPNFPSSLWPPAD